MKIAEAYAEISVKTGPFNRQLGEIRSATEKTTKSIQQRFNALAPTFRKIGIGMTVAGGAITAALGLAVKSSIDFNKEMANIATLIPGSTKRVNELKSAIRTMAVEVGKDTGDLAQGAYQVISAFGDTADTVGILGIAAKAATAGVATTTDSINLLSAVTKGYGDISKEAVQKVSDLAFQTVTLGQTTFPELAGSIGKVTPLAASLGMNMEELFAVMATGTGVTGKASEVSTQLRGILQSLMAPTADMGKLIKSMGYESGQAMLQELGLSGALQVIVKSAQASGQPLQKYISQIEGQTLALALTGAQSDTYIEKLAAMRNSIGLTDVAFKEQTEGVNKAGFAFQQAKQQITVLGQEIGDRLLPAIVPLIKNVAELVKKISSWMKEHEALTGIIVKAVAVIGGLLLVLGPLLIMLPSLISLLPILGIAFHAALGPIGLITGAIAAITIGIILLHKAWTKNWGGIQEKTRAVVNTITKYFIKFVNFMSQNILNPIISGYETFYNTILKGVGWLVEKVIGLFGKLPNFILKAFGTSKEEVKVFAGDIREKFSLEFRKIPKIAEDAFKWIAPVKEDTKALGDTLSTVGDTVSTVGNIVIPVINKITDETEGLTEAEKKLEEQLAKLRGEEYIKALENMIKRAKEQKERTEEQEKALKALQERLEKVRGTEYIRAIQNMILRQIEQKERAEEQEEALKKLQERLSKLRGEQYIVALQNMITRAVEQKQRTEEQEKALKALQEQLTKLRGQEYIRSLEEMIKRAQEQKDRTEEQEKELKELQELLKELRGKEYIKALENMIKRAIEQKDRTEEQEKALKKLQDRLKALRATEYIRALQNMILRQIEQKKRAEEQEKALKALQERLAELRGTEYIRALEEMITRQEEQKERTEEQEKALRELQERLSKLRGQEYIRALQEMIKRAKEQKERTEEQEKALKELQDRLDKLRGEEYIRALKEMIKRQIEMKERTEDLGKTTKKVAEEIKSIYESLASSIKSTFSDLFYDLMMGTKKFKDIWQDFCNAMKSAFIRAIADMLVEKILFGLELEGNILEWGNLFAGLGKLAVGVWKGIGDAVWALGKGIWDLGKTIVSTLGGLGVALVTMFVIAAPKILASIREIGEKGTEIALGFGLKWDWVMKQIPDYVKEGMEEVFDSFEELVYETGFLTTKMGKLFGELFEKTKSAWKKWVDFVDGLFGDMGDNAAATMNDIANESKQMTGSIRSDLDSIPRIIPFDIIGKLHMPDIPFISARYFDIFGRYHAPSIPSYQVGIPYVPRTQVAVIHKKEAVLTASQAREWRAGGKGSEGNTFYTRILHTGDIRSEMDEKQLIRKIADEIVNQMRRS